MISKDHRNNARSKSCSSPSFRAIYKRMQAHCIDASRWRAGVFFGAEKVGTTITEGIYVSCRIHLKHRSFYQDNFKSRTFLVQRLLWWFIDSIPNYLFTNNCVNVERSSKKQTVSMNKKLDIQFLERTIELAEEAVKEGNHPFGALLVSASGEILAEGKNNFLIDKGPGHAETNLAREAARRFDSETLLNATLYTSVEPCSMCSGTIYWANIGAVVFGMTEKRLGELTGDDPENLTQDLDCRTVLSAGQRTIEVRGPYSELEDRIVKQHAEFWK